MARLVGLEQRASVSLERLAFGRTAHGQKVHILKTGRKTLCGIQAPYNGAPLMREVLCARCVYSEWLRVRAR